jgi:nicotinamidase/pyrazinamidase
MVRLLVIEDARRGINLKGSLAAAWKQIGAKGVKRIQSADIETAQLPSHRSRA